MRISSKIRMALAGLTVVALVGGVMAASPAEAGKKKRHKKVVKIHKGKSVKQISKGGNATGGNGGAGGSGGSSGAVNNTGNVGGGAGSGLTDAQAACIGAAFALADAADAPLGAIDGPITDAFVAAALTAAGCGVTPADIPASVLACVRVADDDGVLTTAEALGCLDNSPGAPGSGSVFSGNAGNGAAGGNGGNATGGAGGSNTNSSTRTVTSDDHSIDVD